MRAPYAVVISTFVDCVEIVVPKRRRLFREDLPEETVTFAWQDVTRVAVFKRDQFTVDCICLAFELNGNHLLEVNEDMDGWKALVEAVPFRLQGALSEEQWWEKVVSPAFKPCWTEVYTRP